VVDLPSALSDITLALLDAADWIIQIVTYDSTTLRNTLAIAETFHAIGYSADKVHFLVNRSDSTGGMSPDDLHRALGRAPEYSMVSDGMLVVQSNNEGVPFVLANPSAQISKDIGRVAAAVTGREQAVSSRRR
jgi:Flp pilus assembly CpaE family ATPase